MYHACLTINVISLFLLRVAVCTVTTCAAENGHESAKRSEFPFGIQIHYRGREYEIPGVSTSRNPRSIICCKQSATSARVICSVGDGVNPKSHRMNNHGDDPGDCVVFLDPETGKQERVSYHQPGPDILAVSVDGRYAAMASLDGWASDVDGAPPGGRSSREPNPVSSQSEAKDRLRAITVGTLRYSIWDVSTARPIWEMRFYDKTPERGMAARFERPWARYAQLILPWWAMRNAPLMNRQCRIGFSPTSKHLVALDPGHGVHILRIDDGNHVHCCPTEADRRPVMFAFNGSSSEVAIICSDSAVRVFDLDSGLESASHSLRLPKGALITRRTTGFDFVNFTIEPNSGTIGFVSGEELLTSTLSGGILSHFTGIGRFADAGRIEVSLDRKRIGVGYGYGNTADDVRPGRMVLYELLDASNGLAIKRVAVKGLELNKVAQRTSFIAVREDLQACLDLDGGDIVYAFPLPSR